MAWASEDEPVLAAGMLDRAAEILRRAEGFGAQWRGTRFERYLSTVRERDALERSGDQQGFAAHRADLQRQSLLFESLSQLVQLEGASSVWDHLRPTLLSEKLSTAFR